MAQIKKPIEQLEAISHMKGINNPEIDIAPGINATDWHALNLDDPKSNDWGRAIEIFRSRIKERYIEPAQILLELDEKRQPINRKYGFTILAIDSLLVETLWAFKKGLTDTKNKSRRAFKEFLTNEDLFSFSEEQAIRFYEDFRCGILHQAEIGNNSKVWSIGPLIHAVEGQWIVNRTEFHNVLVTCFEQYCEQLADSNNTDLRRKFRDKMKHISRVNHYAK